MPALLLAGNALDNWEKLTHYNKRKVFILLTAELQEKEIINSNAGFADFGLPPFLREGLKRMGFEQPTDIQAQAIPALMNGQDLMAQSQTGSGKTAAFALPLLARVQRGSRELQALIMVPTRELALQVTQVFKDLAGPSVRITPIYGGAGMEGQVRGLRTGGYQVVVGTPGRLRDHLNRGTLRLDRVRMIVLDEADEMLDRGFAPDVEAIVQAAPPAAQRQTALFSATLPEWVTETASKHLRPSYASIALTPDASSRAEIAHEVYDMNTADKTFALRHLLDTYDKQPILVFVRTKFGVKKLSDKLQEDGYSAAGLQGNLSQRAREEVMSAFRNGRVRVMVATNVGARGLDVSGISHVINFDLPESTELFTHRIGRTGRNGASGTAITFLTGEDRGRWRDIERSLTQEGIEIKRQHWDGPKAAPGAAPAFIQPLPRGFGGGGGGRFGGSRQEEPRRQFAPRPAANDNFRNSRETFAPAAPSRGRSGNQNRRDFEPAGNRSSNQGDFVPADNRNRNQGDFDRTRENGNDRRFDDSQPKPRRSRQY